MTEIDERSLDLMKIGESLNKKTNANLVLDKISQIEWQLAVLPVVGDFYAEVEVSKTKDSFIVTFSGRDSEDNKKIKGIKNVTNNILNFFTKETNNGK